ncbi:MAG TPA: methyltransferase [Polyangia bacterium]|nr:methyltransferase [Polyangia bacterium]
MTNPDDDGLVRLVAWSGWGALVERLRAIGVSPGHAAESLRVGREASALPRHPLVAWHLRQRADDAAIALRSFFVGEPVDEASATRALGSSFAGALEVGLLVRTGGDVVCPFRFAYADDVLVLSDRLEGGGPDAVMGPGATTAELARIARPLAPVASALDLGCGAGTLALLRAPHAARVVGTDVNARALAFARVSAALAGRAVDWRAGDLFAPVAGETFELVVAQPPFVPRPSSATETTYLHGGARGDELARRVLAGVPAALAPGGRAFVLSTWPTFDRPEGDALEARAAKAIGDANLGVTIFAGPPFDVDDWCTLCSAQEHPTLDAAFDADAIALREHVGALGVTGFSLAAIVVERPSSGPGWSASFPGVAISRLDAAHVEATLRAQRLAAGPDDALLAARLRWPAGSTFRRQPNEGGSPRFQLRFDAASPWPTLTLDELTAAVATTLADAPDVRTAVETMRAPSGAAREPILRVVRQALARGVVQAG